MINLKKLTPYPFLVVFILAFASCKKEKETNGRINEGYIEYKMQYMGDSLEQFVQAFLPRRMKLIFKDNNTKNHISDATGLFSFTHIKNQKEGIQAVLMNIMKDKYKYVAPLGEESAFFKDRPDMRINHKEDTKRIAGYSCRKAKIVYPAGEKGTKHFNIYYTDQIDIKGFTRHTPFQPINGVLMEFQLELYQMPFRLIATKVEREKIPDGAFTIPQNYKTVNKKTMREIIEVLKER